jgi:zinc/manganese transport system substrate-binding protein
MKLLWISLLLSSALMAKLQVSVAYPYIDEITKAIGKEKVITHLLSRGDWDPHFVVPKPSLIGKLRQSDMLILNGASLEIGWLPPLIERSHNPDIQKNAKGYIDLSLFIELREIPTESIDRSMGHVHAEGNPHFILDPHNLVPLAEVIMLALSTLDKENYAFYKQNYEKFKAKWQAKVAGYDATMKQCRGIKVIQYHELFNYFFARYGITSVESLEPLPGIKPNAKHTQKLIDMVKQKKITFITQDVYHEDRTANFIAKKSGVKVVKLPHDVGALKGVTTLEDFYGDLVKKLCR